MKPRKIGSGRATRPDYAAMEWRKEAVMLRGRLAQQDGRITTAITLLTLAADHLARSEARDDATREAVLHLIDAIATLTGTDERKNP